MIWLTLLVLILPGAFAQEAPVHPARETIRNIQKVLNGSPTALRSVTVSQTYYDPKTKGLTSSDGDGRNVPAIVIYSRRETMNKVKDLFGGLQDDFPVYYERLDLIRPRCADDAR